MARFFIHRPIFAIVIALIIVICGTIAGLSLPVAQYPQITQPTVEVSTVYVGANSDVINKTVAQVVEEQVNGTQGMDYMDSTSDDSGSYVLTVKFDLGTDADMDTVPSCMSVPRKTDACKKDTHIHIPRTSTVASSLTISEFCENS